MKKIEVSCVDIETRLENPDNMALCPLCEKVILTFDAISISQAYGMLSLCHSLCVLEVDET